MGSLLMDTPDSASCCTCSATAPGPGGGPRPQTTPNRPRLAALLCRSATLSWERASAQNLQIGERRRLRADHAQSPNSLRFDPGQRLPLGQFQAELFVAELPI